MIKEKKNISLDDLATMVQKGFTEVYDRMDTGFLEVHGRMDKFESHMTKFENRIELLSKDVAAIRFTLTQLAYRDEVNQLEERLTRIEKHLGLSQPQPSR